jgi:hypothetical protein
MTTRALLRTILLLVIILSTVTMVSHAQRGWYLSGKVGYDRMQFDNDNEHRNGNNYEIDFGFNFNDTFGTYFTVGGSIFDGGDSKMGFFEVGPRVVLWKGAKLQPYVDLMARAATIDNGPFSFSQTGFGGSGAIGAHYFLNYAIAINGSVSVSRVNFNDVKFAGIKVEGLDDMATNARFRLGLSFFFR